MHQSEQQENMEQSEKPYVQVMQTAQLCSIKIALHEYHQALNERKNASVAGNEFIRACEEILNQPWKQESKTGLDKQCIKVAF